MFADLGVVNLYIKYQTSKLIYYLIYDNLKLDYNSSPLSFKSGCVFRSQSWHEYFYRKTSVSEHRFNSFLMPFLFYFLGFLNFFNSNVLESEFFFGVFYFKKFRFQKKEIENYLDLGP